MVRHTAEGRGFEGACLCHCVTAVRVARSAVRGPAGHPRAHTPAITCDRQTAAATPATTYRRPARDPPLDEGPRSGPDGQLSGRRPGGRWVVATGAVERTSSRAAFTVAITAVEIAQRVVTRGDRHVVVGEAGGEGGQGGGIRSHGSGHSRSDLRSEVGAGRLGGVVGRPGRRPPAGHRGVRPLGLPLGGVPVGIPLGEPSSMPLGGVPRSGRTTPFRPCTRGRPRSRPDPPRWPPAPMTCSRRHRR